MSFYLSCPVARGTSTKVILLQHQALVERFETAQHYDVLAQYVNGEHAPIRLAPFCEGFV